MAYENVKNLVAEYNDAKASFQSKMNTTFGDIFSEFFTNFPEIKAVVWNQYTPYFNDGEACEFGVNDKYLVDTNSSVDLDDVYSAWSIDEEFPSVYYGKPSKYIYEDRNNYPEYEEQITRYEEASKDPRYELVQKGWEELNDVLSDIPEEIYLDAFGDHAFVVATKAGIDVREYDHE